ncbi:HNH endonuclease signature motif containing protein [Microbacterium istanbulense]|uniref:DUF222 domain-containing protein n=1 Tax=Microbacterium istanbulense TaxID=3122049 RepID=A0ABU8LKF8_9MICO
MELFTEVEAQLEVLRSVLGDDDATPLSAHLAALDDAAVLRALEASSSLIRVAQGVQLVASGVVARRSERASGHGGLAQARGHRGAVTLVQAITGGSRAEAARTVRVGESLMLGSATDAPVSASNQSDAPAAQPGAAPAARVWHAVIDDAVVCSVLTPAQHDAIRRGLGEPPEPTGVGDSRAGSAQCTEAEALAAAAREAWAVAAAELVTEAGRCTVEELARTARTIRDRLDPEGAEARFLARYEARSFRMWTDADGIHRGSLVFDDEAALWVRTIVDSALRPRRGGPRFVDPDESAQATDLADEPRSNDQLAYDLMLDVLRAGALADAETVFGTRQAGVRVVRVVASDNSETSDRAGTHGHAEDGLTFLPGATVDQRVCETGVVSLTVNGRGNPLDVGREQRLFTPRQRVALAARDGGCRWPQCDRPASYCEAHHTVAWSDGGRTDVDDGILLCRHHHMNLHHHGWWITRLAHPHRQGRDREEPAGADYRLHHPSGTTIDLHPRLALRYAWGDIDPPPPRFRPAA